MPTQVERRAETRAKLLDATVTSIVEHGLAATTSRRICDIAGVSSGAQTHHFPFRTDLLGAVIEHVSDQRIDALRATASEFPEDRRQRLAALLDQWWADLNGPAFEVFVKLWVAAKDDRELHTRLVAAERRMNSAIRDLHAEVIGDDPLKERIDLVAATLRGLALMEQFEPRARRGRNRWPRLREQLLELLDAG
jgi:AcrR family transcriptional regulator